jgi:hypothetical protein
MGGCGLFRETPPAPPPAARALPPPEPQLPKPNATHHEQVDPSSDNVSSLPTMVF